jgi:phytanoyl-CoA hydroxylase
LYFAENSLSEIVITSRPMEITPEQFVQYERDGFLVLDDFVAASTCDRLRERAKELVNAFDPKGLVSIFSTCEQNRLSDDYFLESGVKICFFFEEHAFLPDGRLKQSKESSINAYTLHVISGDSRYCQDNWLQRHAEMPLRGFD